MPRPKKKQAKERRPRIMAICYDEADKETMEMTSQLIEKYHPDLEEGKAKIAVLIAERKTSDGELLKEAALKEGGFPVMATVKINSVKERVQGLADATITLDGNRIGGIDKNKTKAILDRALYSICIRRAGGNDAGTIAKDEANRPKMTLRIPDHRLELYDEMAKRHGEDSQEIIQAKAFMDKAGQLYFSFADDEAAKPKGKTGKTANGGTLGSLPPLGSSDSALAMHA